MSTTLDVERPTRALRLRPRLNLAALPTVAAVVILAVMLVYGELAYGKIFQLNTLSNLFISNSYLIILAVGLTFVILAGGIDLSVGAVVAFASVSGVMLVNAGVPSVLAMVAMVAIGAVFGLMSGVLVQYFNVQPFIATLAMMFLARGLASILSTAPERLADDSGFRTLSDEIKLVDGPKLNDLVITPNVVIALLVAAAGFVLLHRTRFGRTVYAIGGSEQSATLMGLPVARTKVWISVVTGS